MGRTAEAAAKTASGTQELQADVVCVGSGAAALSAAVTATDRGAKVVVLEKMPITGGTTAKSGGGAWIPNSSHLRAAGISDSREDCLRYMARYAYPELYDDRSSTLGIPPHHYRLLTAFYDNAADAIDLLEKIGAAKFELFRMYWLNKLQPDYGSLLPEDKDARGRTLIPVFGRSTDGSTAFTPAMVGGGGAALAASLQDWLTRRGVPIFTEHRVRKVLMQDSRIVSVEVETPKGSIRVRASRGVIFGSGGFAHDTNLLAVHQPLMMGSCASPSSTGDILPIVSEVGARIGPLSSAWNCHVLAEEALDNRVVGSGVSMLPGDSMILVNRSGKRIVNEKGDYNDRGRVHAVFDSSTLEFPNKLLFMLFDDRTLDAFAGSFPLPSDERETGYLIKGNGVDGLSKALAQRLTVIAARTGDFRLAADFAENLQLTLARYNIFARAGDDLDFGRGKSAFDRDFHMLTSARRPASKYPANTLPNNTMYPISTDRKLYAFVLGMGALDTNCGPFIDEQARILDWQDRPIPGLYGAGNCIAGPARTAYFGGGGTIGPALTFGYIAARACLAST
jgi:hypothetical protein